MQGMGIGVAVGGMLVAIGVKLAIGVLVGIGVLEDSGSCDVGKDSVGACCVNCMASSSKAACVKRAEMVAAAIVSI